MSPTNAHLETRELRIGYGGRDILSDLTLRLRPGVITAIIGPNGSGKSTLLRALGRLLDPSSGQVLLDGVLLPEIPTRSLARKLGMLPQSPTAPEGMTVHELVSRGRHPYQGLFSQWSRADEERVDTALALTGLSDLAQHRVETLSGGQRQRAWIALTLAQDTDVLLLDEPTTYLDIAHSLEVLDLVDRLHSELGRTVVMVIHDLNLAIRYADDLVVVHEGKLVAQGHPEAVIDREVLQRVFGLKAQVIDDPVSGRPLILPIGQRHTLTGPVETDVGRFSGRRTLIQRADR